MRDPECPLSKRYSPRLVELEKVLAGRGFGLLYLGLADAELAAKDVETFGLGATYGIDSGLADELFAATTTEVFVLDARRTLAYRGMIDDQYGLGFARPEPTRRYLAEALEAVSEGEPVAVPATQAQGCIVEREGEPASAVGEITYHNRISRIVQQNCQSCHRPGAVGPFALMDYAQVKRKKSMIQWVIEDALMPPWFAAEGSGPWSNDTSLTEEDRDAFLSWIAAGAPEGDPAHAPLPRKWTEGWTIGEPDLVVEMPEPYVVPAEGVVRYQYLQTRLDMEEDRWVKAVEIRPGAAEVVHHVLLFVQRPEEAGNVESGVNVPDGARTYFACNVPGQEGLVFPDGTAKLLPRDAVLTFQLHYTPSGKEATDLTSVGFIFSDEPIEAEVRTTSALDQSFTIPPHAFDYEVSGIYRFPEDARLLSLFPHTHLRGVRFQYDLIFPDGSEELLLELPFYDFNWQLNYEFQSPREVPAGTRMRATAWYDNSPENPANPDPDVAVTFGEQTFEEMMIGFVNWVPAEAAR